MASTRFRFDPREIHECVWHSFSWNSCTAALNLSTRQQEEITLGLLGCVVDELFLSVPVDNVRKYEHVLAEYVSNHVELHRSLALAGEIDPPVLKNSRVVTDVGVFLPVIQERQRQYWDVAPKWLLCKLAFSKVYETLFDLVESKLLGMCKLAGIEFNPYAVVSIEPRFLHNRQIISLELVVGNDVRFQVYDKLFPSGRYDPSRIGN